MRFSLAASIALSAFCAVIAPRAAAIPIPFKNCGKPGDLLSISKADATYWPPVGAPVPLSVTATLDPSGTTISGLQARLSLLLDWAFESGPVNFPVKGGFVTLPSSVPMTLVSPALPIHLGPYNLFETFNATNPPMSIVTAGNLGQTITTATGALGLLFNGAPGFPVNPGNGTYEASLQLSTLTGQEVFCVDFTLVNIAFASTAPFSIPTLSGGSLIGLAVLLAVCGALVLRRQLP
jgi:hypothetical protein